MNSNERESELLALLIKRMAEGLSASDIEKMLAAAPVKKKRGRPRKAQPAQTVETPAPPFSQPKISLCIEEAAEAVGLSRSAMYEHIASGKLASFKVGKRRLILAADLKKWIESKAMLGRR